MSEITKHTNPKSEKSITKAMNISYEVGENLYLNVTNKCPCDCLFCIRRNDEGAYGSETLWLAHEPSLEEMKENLSKRDMTKYKEVVFCGYGEPLMRLDFVCELAKYLKETYPGIVLRVDSNGLADLYNPNETTKQSMDAASKLSGLVDKVSVSMNAPNAQIYHMVTRPAGFPAEAYPTMLNFAKRCQLLGIDVCFTLVDVINHSDIQEAKNVAYDLGIPLHVREHIKK